ncbi:MAG: hypothetical protein IT314_03810 [Anaerolineales bacterium]|nr:hypothetical protein [Anaerolineales bacterium]
MSKTRCFAGTFLAVLLILSGCNLPSNAPATEAPDAIQTNAALTVESLLNQSTPFNTPTLPSAPPTNTVVAPPTVALPTATSQPLPSATPNCDLAQFVKDVTIPDGSNFNAGDHFTKTWRLKNIGTCTWTGYALVFDSGDAMSGASPISIGTVASGQEVDVSVNLTAPSSNGTYRGYWRIRNASGVLIPVQGGAQQNKSFYVEIKVGGSSGGPFAVSSVAMSVSGSCGNFTITANVTANGAGNVTYKWIRSDGAIDGAAHPPIVFASAGSQSVSTTWSVSASGSFWMDIYIDAPNHQQFGRANFSCP